MDQVIESTAARILIVGGLFNIVFGFIIGHLLGLFRMNDPDKPYRYLLSAHKAGLQQGFLLLGLVFVLMLSELTDKMEIIASILLVSSTVFLNLGEIMNAAQNVEDEFKSRPLALHVKSLSALLSTIGIGILVYGIILVYL